MSWDWQVFCQDTITQEVGQSCFGKNGDITYLDWMLSAWGCTISVSLLSLVIALVVGSLIGTLRTLEGRPWIVRLGNAWVELFRNIPLLVHIFMWYHVVPSFVPCWPTSRRNWAWPSWTSSTSPSPRKTASPW